MRQIHIRRRLNYIILYYIAHALKSQLINTFSFLFCHFSRCMYSYTCANGLYRHRGNIFCSFCLHLLSKCVAALPHFRSGILPGIRLLSHAANMPAISSSPPIFLNHSCGTFQVLSITSSRTVNDSLGTCDDYMQKCDKIRKKATRLKNELPNRKEHRHERRKKSI